MDARLALAVLLLASASIAEDCSFEPNTIKNNLKTNIDEVEQFNETPVLYELTADGRTVPAFELHGLKPGEKPWILSPSTDLEASPTFKRNEMKALTISAPLSQPASVHKYFMDILMNDKLGHPDICYSYIFTGSEGKWKRIIVVFKPTVGTTYKDLALSNGIEIWDVKDYTSPSDLHGKPRPVYMMANHNSSANLAGCAPNPVQQAEVAPAPAEKADAKLCDSCAADQYCGSVSDDAKDHAAPGVEVPEQVCMDNGFRPGTCSMEYINCDKYANCTDSADGYSYKCMCPEEATGDGYTAGTGCTLMYSVCVDDFDCPEYGRCKDNYKCECNPGFEGDPRYNCTDIVDCPSDKCDENAICKDHPGTFSCTCDIDNGYYGDGSPGSCKYQCHGDQDCHVDAFCNANHLCECRNGYEGSGNQCHDVAECSNGQNNCHEHAECHEETGAYKCVCKNGYEGDGFKCSRMPRDCIEILKFNMGLAFGKEYYIDPDFTGPAGKMKVSCNRRPDGLIITRVKPTPNEFPLNADDNILEIPYEAGQPELKAFVDHFKFCRQEIELNCLEGFKLFPHTKWYDGHGNTHQSFGSPNANECSCGAVGACEAGCACDGKGYADESALFINKTMLPVMKFEFSHPDKSYTKATIKRTNFLLCAHKQFDIPKDCHEAKFDLGMKKNGPLYIDPDGDDGAAPFLAFCDVETYDHVGVTIVNPRFANPSGDVQYNINPGQMKALVDNSEFCAQKVEYNCKNSGLMGATGGRVSGPNGDLGYFPGADGAAGQCGCGATKSCDDRTASCNCNIKDGKMRKDFGLIINKADLPATRVTEEAGADSASSYNVGGLECGQKQFGIEPNCEKYRASRNIYEDYSYFVDPDGPGGLRPFLAECEFDASPPQGKTIIHHEEETPKVQPETLLFAYLNANKEQIAALKGRSTYCSQSIEVGCNKYSLKYDGKSAKWVTADGKTRELSKSMDSCAIDGTKCKCNSQWENQSDMIHLVEMNEVPAQRMDFGETNSQGMRSELTVKVGPLVCAEVFPNCAELKKYMDLQRGVEGENELPVQGVFTVDPDGPGGVDPFSVTCRFPATVINIGPGEDTDSVVSDPKITNPPGTNPELNELCVPISYYDILGNKVSPEQITALVQSSRECTQELKIECKYAKASGRVNFTSCDGTTHRGISSFGEDTCSCGVTGSCLNPQQLCNCDDENKRWKRSDGGAIVAADRLPVCEICMATEAYPPGTNPRAPAREMTYELGQLECNGNPGTGGQTCQEYRKKYGRVGRNGVDMSVVLDGPSEPVPIGCRLTHAPPIGEMVTYPKDPVKEPNGTVDVELDYFTVNINLTKEHMERNEYCTQTIYIFGGNHQNVELNSNNFWYDFNGNKFTSWDELKEGHDDLKKMCKEHKQLCKKHGQPRGFRIREMENLPVKGVVLGDVTDVYLIAGEASCLDLLQSCQHIVEHPTKRFSGDVGGYKYVIDPDGPGDVKPFVVTCHLDFPNKNGISEVKLNKPFKKNKPINVKDADEPLEKELDVNYLYINDPEQIDALTDISDFCWQTVQHVCDQSPVNKDGAKVTTLQSLNGGELSSYGTGNETSFDGCACAQIGACTDDSLKCNCDAGGEAIDQGSITNNADLPLTKIKVGGQSAGGEADVFVNSVRCSKRPVDPPHDCAEALKWKKKYDINYRMTGDFLISPSPYDPEIKPFMAHCDMDTFPGIGVTVIHPRKDEVNSVESTPDADGNIPAGQKYKKKIPHTPGVETTVDTEYFTPTDKQVKALVNYSKYCYQTVRFECQNSPIFAGGNHWITLGDDTKTPRKFWGGGKSDEADNGFCACGLENNCGGLDSATEQRARKCNCDANDGQLRSDAGVITNKDFLPIGSFVTGANSDFGSINMTVGPIYCADRPLDMNECTLGFNDCHMHAECVDTEDAYRCFCKAGWQGKGAIKEENGPRANGRECIDDDECTWNPCPEDSTCLNLPGSFNCTCNTGFRQLGPMECEDIDECAEGTHICAEDADCKNLHGSHACRCKAGYRGDGYKECIPVGQCFIFGDPHVISFDNNWVHHQGDCEYVMSQDGCAEDEEQTYRVTVEHWKGQNVRPGYYSWTKAVHLNLMKLGYLITLHQDFSVTVNGVTMNQYHHSHIISVARILEHIRVSVVTGLELNWDGMDVVEVNVPMGDIGKTCGICGNFNNKTEDDPRMGPACPSLEGQLTDNYDLLGRSWTAMDTPRTCKVDCDPTIKPSPNVTEDRCTYPMQMIKQECEHLLGKNTEDPFNECMIENDQHTLDEFMYSCIMDGCYEEFNLGARICHFARAVNQHCNTYNNIKTPDWRSKLSCAKVDCPSNKVYNACGVPEPKTCVNMVQDHHTDSLAYGDVCVDGCFCPEGLVQEGDHCVKPEDCGCFYHFRYLEKDETMILENCTSNLVCLGNNQTRIDEYECGHNMLCGKNETDGHIICVCEEGTIYEPVSKTCKTNECYTVTCEVKGSFCENGTCRCKDGYMADCGVCIDIDECHTGEHECSYYDGFECLNTEGSYQCKCRQGLQANGTKCSDIDECHYGLMGCGANSQCNNLWGGADCECCAGYKMNDEKDCVRDTSIEMPANSKCCSCEGSRCAREGQVCGTDGKTYTSYRLLKTQTCLEGKEDDTAVEISYPGECQHSCETIVCDKKFSHCEVDQDGIPQCSCPTCSNVTTMYEEDMVCATNKITYISLCHLNKDSCEANIETDIQVETIGKPCPPPVAGGSPSTPGDWSEWGPCSESCKQGVQMRTRDTNGVPTFNNQTKPCYNTCQEGPCRPETCPTPGSVCTVNGTGTTCSCPSCDEPKSPICGRIGNYISTFDSECAMYKDACEQGEADFEHLENNRCEDKPKGCGRIRNFKTYEDENGCKADREVDMGYCYGGCKEGNENQEMCCYGTKIEHKFVIMQCPDGTRKNKFVKQIKECDCIKTADIPAPAMNVVN